MTNETDEQIRGQTRVALTEILEFDLRYKVARFVDRGMLSDFRSFEELLHVNYPIKGLSIRLNPADPGRPFDRQETPIAPESVVADYARFPYEAVAATYLFTLMERHGVGVIAFTGGNGGRVEGGWHADVTSDLDPDNPQQASAQARKLAVALGVDPAAVDPGVVAKLARLKAIRNDVVHRASTAADYEVFLDGVISVVTHVHMLAVPNEHEIVIHPREVDEHYWPDRWQRPKGRGRPAA